MATLRKAMAERGWTLNDLLREVNARLSQHGHEPVEYETVRRWALPIADKLHQTPKRVAMALLRDCFAGELSADVFYPALSPPDASVSRETLAPRV